MTGHDRQDPIDSVPGDSKPDDSSVDVYADTGVAQDLEPTDHVAPVLAYLRVGKRWLALEVLSLGPNGMTVRMNGAPPQLETVVLALRENVIGAQTIHAHEAVVDQRRDARGAVLRLRHLDFLASGGRKPLRGFLERGIGLKTIPAAGFVTGPTGVRFEYERVAGRKTRPYMRQTPTDMTEIARKSAANEE